MSAVRPTRYRATVTQSSEKFSLLCGGERRPLHQRLERCGLIGTPVRPRVAHCFVRLGPRPHGVDGRLR